MIVEWNPKFGLAVVLRKGESVYPFGKRERAVGKRGERANEEIPTLGVSRPHGATAGHRADGLPQPSNVPHVYIQKGIGGGTTEKRSG